MLLSFAICCGGTFLLSGCDQSSQSEIETPDKPDDPKDDDKKDDDVGSAQETTLKVQGFTEQLISWPSNAYENIAASDAVFRYISGSSSSGSVLQSMTLAKGTASNSMYKWYALNYHYRFLIYTKDIPNGYAFEKIICENCGNRTYTATQLVDRDGDYVHECSCSANGATITTKVFWTRFHYTITFNANGGSCDVSSKEMLFDTNYSTQYGSLPTPTRAGYTFGGWYTSTSYTTRFYASTLVTSNYTLYAKWTANKYTVTFSANGGSGTMSNISATYDNWVRVTTNAYTRRGYTFAGWLASGLGSNAKIWKNSTTTDLTSSLIIHDYAEIRNCTDTNGATVKLTAQWTPITYTLKFYSGGGTGSMTDRTVTFDQNFTLVNNGTFKRTGYTFCGWSFTGLDPYPHYYGTSATSQSSTVATSFSHSISDTTTGYYKNLLSSSGTASVTAVWSANTYNVSFCLNDGTTGVNMFVPNAITSGATSNGLTVSWDDSTSIMTVNGTETGSVDIMSVPIKYSIGDEYTISTQLVGGSVTGTSGTPFWTFDFYGNGGRKLYSDAPVKSTKFTHKFNIDSTNYTDGETGLIYVRIYNYYSPVYTNAKIKIKIEKGSTATDFSFNTKKVTYDVLPYGTLPVPTRGGYDFVGWSSSLLTDNTLSYTRTDTTWATGWYTGLALKDKGIALLDGKTYRLSFDLKTTGGTETIPWSNNLLFINDNTKPNSLRVRKTGESATSTSITSTWTRYYGDFTYASDTTSSWKTDQVHIYPNFTDKTTQIVMANLELICLSDATYVTSSTYVKIPCDHTLYAQWKPISRNVNIVVKSSTASDVDTFSESVAGMNSLEYSYYNCPTDGNEPNMISGTISTTSASFGVADRKTFKLSTSAKSGYVFINYSTTNSLPSAASPLGSPLNYSSSITTNTTIYLWFKAVSANQAKYDSTESYWYFEDGMTLQSYVGTSMNSTLNSNIDKTSSGIDSIKYYNKGAQTVKLYSYGGETYGYLTAPKTMKLRFSGTTYTFTQGQTYWFKYEPIRWRITDYKASRYNFDGTMTPWFDFGSHHTNFWYASDKIIYASQMTANQYSIGPNSTGGYLDTYVKAWKDDAYTMDAAIRESTFNYLTNMSANYTVFNSQTNSSDVKTVDSSFRLRVANVEELCANYDDLRAKPTDYVAFLLGVNSDQYCDYFTRDVGKKYYNMAGIGVDGRVHDYYTNQFMGMRIVTNFSEGSRY